jgi:beta-galactosidase/beta-glucuronidase
MRRSPDPRRGFPRPQLERENWISLNGAWDLSFADADGPRSPIEVAFTHTITVPFSPETPASGIDDPGFHPVCWYRRSFPTPEVRAEERLLLHFGAVDDQATVWVNGRYAGQHRGGYAPFTFDITDLLVEGAEQQVVVRADDDPADLTKPRGKQDWQLTPHSIWYPRTTGIWQTVWLEIVPTTRIDRVRWSASLERWEFGLEVRVAGWSRPGLHLRVELRVRDTLIARDRYEVVSEDVLRRIALSDPGIDDYRNELLWSPETPTLVDGTLELWEGHECLDRVRTYTALRSTHVDGQRFLLNSRPYMLRLVLDQGYWLDSGLTAPDDAALRRDVELAKAMGFNGVRKHQKIEDPRFLYWADHLGLLVWEEMPSAYRFTVDAIDRLTEQWVSVLLRDGSHPCIVAWVPFNESWGVPNLPEIRAERDFVAALYHLTKAIDPTRPVIGNDGWESVMTDIIGVHDYDPDPERLGLRYRTDAVLPRLIRHERPAGRRIVLGEHTAPTALVLSEFGGIALQDESGTTWGYSQSHGADQLARHYTALLEAVRSCDILAGFCYTQFADTYQEANGLLRADRTPKIPIDIIAAATGGPRALDAAGSTSTPVAAAPNGGALAQDVNYP